MPTYVDIEKVKALLEALEAEQNDVACSLLDELTGLRESELYQQLNQLSDNLHQTLDELGDHTLLMQTKHDLPDTTERLEYVIQTTQEASEKTLDIADSILQKVAMIEELVVDESSLTAISPVLDEIKENLSDIMIGQSYQDLTGQVLNRIIFVIGSIEQSLIQLIENSRYEYHSIPEKDDQEDDMANLMKGLGPNVTQKSKKDVLDQDDVDSLLDDLGI